jgi:L-lysine exporter family protein LysE/ArgO
MVQALVAGFLLGFSLILAIGSQNAFVLRQGLKRQHVAVVVAICAGSDVLLIFAGVCGMGQLVVSVPGLLAAFRWIGVAFLLVYGALRFRSAWAGGERLVVEGAAEQNLGAVVTACLLFTWANPHVYLDTVMLVGALASQYAPHHWAFGFGAAFASLVFFSALGFGARLLTPLFARPRAWVVLEVVMGVTMWAIAARLAFGD